jgi:hypothetical protein
MTERRKDPRSFSTTYYQERRRIAALEQQQSARSKAIDSRRRLNDLVLVSEESQEGEGGTAAAAAASVAVSSGQHQVYKDISMSFASSSARETTTPEEHRRQQQKEFRQHWASQLMNPEWLIEIPTDLATEWYVLPRPEGQRCTVFASKGKTIARLRNGVIFDHFQSALPFGSRETSGGGGGQANHSLLDCIYHAETETYYILGMIWGN